MPVFFLLYGGIIFAQDIDARSPRPNQGSPQQRAAEKKKAKQQQQLSKAIEKGKQRHLKIQAKNARKMIKNSKRKSKRWNEGIR